MAWTEIGLQFVCIGFAQSSLPPASPALRPSLHQGEDNHKTTTQSLAVLQIALTQVGRGDFQSPSGPTHGLRLLDLATYARNDKKHCVQYNGGRALTEYNAFYGEEKKAAAKSSPEAAPRSSLRTSVIHRSFEKDLVWLGRSRFYPVGHDSSGGSYRCVGVTI